MHRRIDPNEEFEILTLPTTPRGVARVMPGRGVKINHLYYWCEAFRDATVEGSEVAVRYDPYDAGRAYAYARNHWHRCHSEYYAQFQQRTERELQIATAELRRRNQQHGKRLSITAHRLATFLSSVEADEAILEQRLRDGETRRSKQSPQAAALPELRSGSGQAGSESDSPVEEAKSYFPGVKTYDPTELETYEEY